MLQILYQDSQLVVCVKPSDVLSQDGGAGSMPALLKQELGVEEVYPIHRLDKSVGGVMVYALTAKAAAALSRAVQERTLEKRYLAVLRGVPAQKQGELEDLLFHDKMKNKTYVVSRLRKGVKDAKLSYTVLQEEESSALVLVRLFTGRTHQIRVQFASRKLPLVGDVRYGGKTSGALGLWSYGLSFPHPQTGKRLTFCHRPPQDAPWDRFSEKHLQTDPVW